MHPDPTNTSPIPVTVHFSETVTGFTASDVSLTNATVSNFAGANADYSFDLIASGQGTVSATINAAVCTDAAGNGNVAATPVSRMFDTIVPTPVIAGAQTVTNTTRTVTIDFGEVVNGFTLSGVSVSNGTASNLQPSGPSATYTVDVLGAGIVTVSIMIPAGVATDDAGNPNAATASPFEYPFDDVAPTVDITLDDPTPTGLDAVHFSVDFSESVGTSFDASDVALAGTLSGAIAVSGIDPSYTVTVTLADPNANGTLGITTGASITDLAGNPCAGGVSPLYTIANWPGFTTQPAAEARMYTGDAYTFVVAIGSGPGTTSYQWKWDDGSKTIHDGPATTTWPLTGITAANRGQYWCEVTYNGVTYPSTPATLFVEDHLQIVRAPGDADVRAGGAYTFEVTASGGYAPLTYQWYKDGTAIPDASTTACALTPIELSDAGLYRVEIADANSETLSASAELRVTAAVPLAGLAGVLLLLAAMACGAMATLRRTKET